jgi:hypothetical protein
MSNFKKISIYQIDKLALNLEPELFMIRKEAGKGKVLSKLLLNIFDDTLARSLPAVADDAAKAAAQATAKKAVVDAAKAAGLSESKALEAAEKAAAKAARRAPLPVGPGAPAVPPPMVPPKHVPVTNVSIPNNILELKDGSGNVIAKYTANIIETKPGSGKFKPGPGTFKLEPGVDKLPTNLKSEFINQIKNHNASIITAKVTAKKATDAAVKAAAAQAAAIAKVEKNILASVQGTSLTDKAKKGAIGLGVLSALYFMLSGSSPSTEGNEADVQKIVQSSISGVPKEDTSIINNTITSIDSLSSALNRVEKSPEIEENISDLQSVKSALAKCNKQINVKESFAYASTLREAENTARSYLPKLENLIPSLNQEDLTLAKNVQNNLNVFLGTVTAAREKI